jgi:phospholipid/cholesterol/gamma-HCH transport system permease protein
MKVWPEDRDQLPVRVEHEKDGLVRFVLSGIISLGNLNSVVDAARDTFHSPPPKQVAVELEGLRHIDSSGALYLLYLQQTAKELSIPFAFHHMGPHVRDVVDLIDRRVLAPAPPPRKSDSPGLVEAVGRSSASFLQDVFATITFSGRIVAELAVVLIHPPTVRWKDVFAYMKRTGVDALPIVALISFLLGLIIAFMSSLQLKQFGANMYVASLVAIAMVRELGPIMTAIIVAGRSGSAFAAEIGTMTVNEEVDALITMGFNPIRFLAVPKVLAAILVVPLLTLFSDLFAIVGGMVVGIFGLDLTFRTYADLTSWALTIFDVVTGLAKSAVFALLISGIGCERGFGVRGGAESVGHATTSAVVSGLFLIIVTDSVFAIMLNYVRW